MGQRFTAHAVEGRGRGKRIGTPTINLHMADVPADLKEGIYACFVSIPNQQINNQKSVIHYGSRPVFHDTASCEVHLLDTAIDRPPETLEIEIVAYLREVRDFPSVEALKDQIADDIAKARAILSV